MNETAPRVIKIPAKPESVRQAELQRQLRVAAYCRVSTKEEDQANSYEVQKEYYTDKIMSNPVWTMAGIFADKGITGTSVKKREDFMRMIRHCRQRKIDVVLTKSVSRFARNTVDCLYYTRALKELGIAVIFEKENINSLEEDSELHHALRRLRAVRERIHLRQCHMGQTPRHGERKGDHPVQIPLRLPQGRGR